MAHRVCQSSSSSEFTGSFEIAVLRRPPGGRGKDGIRRGAVESWDNSRAQPRSELITVGLG
jgi:hypothetical protein